ncbi:MAG: hypothetical protein K6T87_15385 [Roseiflexus sp.]|uniref:hypothetical protein n=1 Tax=Roseiflexus sp. TaxID=2562120 RepID=UPI0025DF97A3|nr:hypothetical protein [Roseiflexus sp.]MCL6541940.1 hypothetical protein [Roseiflexus sp.]
MSSPSQSPNPIRCAARSAAIPPRSAPKQRAPLAESTPVAFGGDQHHLITRQGKGAKDRAILPPGRLHALRHAPG